MIAWSKISTAPAIKQSALYVRPLHMILVNLQLTCSAKQGLFAVICICLFMPNTPPSP